MEKQKVKKFYRKTVKPALFGLVVCVALVILGIILQCVKGGGYYFLSVFAGIFALLTGLVVLTEKSKCVAITDVDITFNDDPEVNGHEEMSFTMRFDEIARITVEEKRRKDELTYEFQLKDGFIIEYDFEKMSQSTIDEIIEIIKNRCKKF